MRVYKLLTLGGFSISHLTKRLLGIAALRMSFARTTGIPLSPEGLQRKIGVLVLKKTFRAKV